MSSRRDFIKKLAAATAGTAAGGIPAVIQKALAQVADPNTGSINDVEHIVILMNENRSFDHYFGTLKGVRGFKDPRAITIRENGKNKSVWEQDSGTSNADPIRPFPINSTSSTDTDGFFAEGLAHTRRHQIEAWNYGKMDAFCSAKGSAPHAMGYFTRDDTPFYHALADAFTVCDAYHAAALANTHLNRAMLMSGRASEINENPQKLPEFATGGYAGDNPDFSSAWKSFLTLAELGGGNSLKWKTIAELLQEKRVTWQVYQNGTNNTVGEGTAIMLQNTVTEQLRNALSSCGLCFDHSDLEKYRWSILNNETLADDNYNCNALPYFSSFSDPNVSPELKSRGMSVKNLEAFTLDVKNGVLPQVSWIIPPYAFSEHPGVELGAPMAELYVSTILEALVSNPDVWKKTVFLLTYDEGDGWFDHMPPPMPADPNPAERKTVNIPVGELETSTKIPVGLGKRVPLIAISPWSTGGWVSSEVFDHTSIVNFICKRFGIDNSFLSTWRRSISGDLSSLFDFTATQNSSIGQTAVDSTASRIKKVYSNIPKHATHPVAGGNDTRSQESGWSPARAVPYLLSTQFSFNGAKPALTLSNNGERGAVFQIYQLDSSGTTIFHYTVEKIKPAEVTLTVAGQFNICVYGPNGFYREYVGYSTNSSKYTVKCGVSKNDNLTIAISDATKGSSTISAQNDEIYQSGSVSTYTLAYDKKENSCELNVNQDHRWYEFNLALDTNTTHPTSVIFAGHIENGKSSVTDPLIGGTRWVKS